MLKTRAQRLRPLPLAFTLAMACLLALFCPAAYAIGEGPDTTPVEPTELQLRVESSADVYNQAAARVDDLQRRIDENSARIAEVEAALPEQRQRAEAAMVAMYKMQGGGNTFAEVLVNSDNLDDFLKSYDLLSVVAQGNVDEMAKLKDMQSELHAVQAQLEAEKAEADEAMAQAEAALAEAQAARQAVIAERAAQVTEEEVQAAREQVVEAAVEQAAQEAADQGLSEEEAFAQVEEARVTAQEAAAETVDATTVASGGVDWNMSKDDFVDEWSTRIDNYLEGSPLEGQGSTFATAAWDNGVDPRWSPAISTIESTKGEYTFADYNAWGWGSSSWDSWEEAINDHVEGLAEGYGSTITYESAEKYCPPEADFWYDSTLEQMNQI